MGKKVEIYGSSNCYYCAQAQRICKMNEYEVVYHDTDKVVNHLALERRLGSEVRYAPHVFVEGEHLPGGYLELQYFLRYR